MSVPSIDLKRFEPGFMEKWIQSVENLTANASFIGGEQVSSLEEKLAVLCESDNVITCANGTDALQLALRCLCCRLNRMKYTGLEQPGTFQENRRPSFYT